MNQKDYKECVMHRHKSSRTTLVVLFISFAVAIVIQAIFAPEWIWMTVLALIVALFLLIYIVPTAYNCGESVDIS